ncbi:MAG: hypothetical protein ACOX22_01210 [Caldicoprobacterales bacterium]
MDSFLVLLLALGFIMLDSKKPEFAGLPFAAAVLTKPQGLILLPVVLFELLKRGNWKALIKTGCIWNFDRDFAYTAFRRQSGAILDL